MANSSEAHGRVYIKASNLKTIEYFLLIQEERNKYVYYPTDIRYSLRKNGSRKWLLYMQHVVYC